MGCPDLVCAEERWFKIEIAVIRRYSDHLLKMDECIDLFREASMFAMLDASCDF